MEAIILAGFGGGVIRGLVGFVKHRYSYKDVPFEPGKFLSTVLISGVIGWASALTVRELGMTFLGTPILSPAMALVIGYAGGDFLENIFKTVMKQPELYSFPEKK
ncbi:hypothetical protein KKI17_01755 [Patescibacteria group bacterium]|nr:hypothetical protein [Patescibacteria group bacterium]